jgi:hypothetical protein
MIYALIAVFLLWALSTAYCIRHIALINKELEELGLEQHTQNKDIMHLLKMDYDIAKAVDTNAKSLLETQAVLEYTLEKVDPSVMKTNNTTIFNTPKGEA